MSDYDIQGWFSIPVYSSALEDPNFTLVQSEMARVVAELEKNDSFKKVKDWDANVQSISDPEFQTNVIEQYDMSEFFKELKKHVYQYLETIAVPPEKLSKFKIVQSWFTKTAHNEYSHAHSHGQADLAGVYYFKTNGQDGSLIFNSPSRDAGNSFLFEHLGTPAVYEPRAGNIVLFPGWLEHSVNTNTTDNIRISLSFNIVFWKNFF